MSCTKADAFLAKRGLTAGTVVDAKQTRFEGRKALTVLQGVKELVVCRGVRFVTLRPQELPASARAGLLEQLLGPSGNLRAPSIKIGRNLLVGFNPVAWEAALG